MDFAFFDNIKCFSHVAFVENVFTSVKSGYPHSVDKFEFLFSVKRLEEFDFVQIFECSGLIYFVLGLYFFKLLFFYY